jgi:hypothetical protein
MAGLLDQAEIERVAVVLPVLGLRRTKDREDHAEDPQNQEQKGEIPANAKGHSRQEGAKDVDGDITDQQGDLEIEGFLRLYRREAASVLEYQPDDEGKQEAQYSAEMGKGRPLSVFSLGQRCRCHWCGGLVGLLPWPLTRVWVLGVFAFGSLIIEPFSEQVEVRLHAKVQRQIVR